MRRRFLLARLLNVGLGDAHQILARHIVPFSQAVGLIDQHLFKNIAHAARVAKGDGIGVGLGDERLHIVARRILQLIAALAALHLEYGQHFVERIVVEMQIAVEARLQAGVRVDKAIHQPVVARHNDHQILAVILHGLEQRIDGLLAEIVLAAAVQGIGLVDEEHAALRLIDNLLRLGGRLADITRHKAASVHLDQLSLREHAQRLIDARHQAGDHGLARAGIAGEHHVQ